MVNRLVTLLVGVLTLTPISVVAAVSFQYLQPFPVHAPHSDSAYQYTYDANGNVQTITAPDSLVTRYEYNSANQIQQVLVNSQKLAGYLYDVRGVRIGKTGNDDTVQEFYFGPVEIKESIPIRYYRARGPNLAKRQGPEPLHFLHHDHVGSTSHLTNAAGELTSDIRYYEFGALRSATSGEENHLFGGKRLSPETRLLDFGPRSYASISLRFLQPDSAVPDPKRPQAFQRYSFGYHNPLKYIDPSGRTPINLSRFRRGQIFLDEAFNNYILGLFQENFKAGFVNEDDIRQLTKFLNWGGDITDVIPLQHLDDGALHINTTDDMVGALLGWMTPKLPDVDDYFGERGAGFSRMMQYVASKGQAGADFTPEWVGQMTHYAERAREALKSVPGAEALGRRLGNNVAQVKRNMMATGGHRLNRFKKLSRRAATTALDFAGPLGDAYDQSRAFQHPVQIWSEFYRDREDFAGTTPIISHGKRLLYGFQALWTDMGALWSAETKLSADGVQLERAADGTVVGRDRPGNIIHPNGPYDPVVPRPIWADLGGVI